MFRLPNRKLTPDEVYAASLQAPGLGHPLWHPEEHGSGEPHIADVGLTRKGEFIRLLNLDTSAPEKAVTYFDPPFTNIAPLPDNTLQISRVEEIFRPGSRHSCGAKSGSLHAFAKMPGGHTASVALEQERICPSTLGAALTLQSTAGAEGIFPSTRLKSYISHHVNQWHQYATQVHDPSIRLDDILLVIGWIKTTPDWAANAFWIDKHANPSPHREGDIVDLSDIDLSWTASKSASMRISSIMRCGSLFSPHTSSDPAAEARRSRSQCVFIKRLSVKQRHISPKLGVPGSASYRLSGSQSRGDAESLAAEYEEGSIEYDWQEYTDDGGVSSSLSIIQDYILQTSPAHCALASDDEVDCMMCNRPIVDLSTLLRKTQFGVDVDDNGAGSLRAEDVIRYKQEQTFAHPPITTVDKKDWPKITRQDAGSLQDAQILPGPSQGKARHVNYRSVVFGDYRTRQINNANCVALSPDGTLLTAASGGVITVWRLQDGLTTQRLENDGDEAQIRQVAWSPDGHRVVSGAENGLALVWDVNTGDVVHRLEGHRQPVNHVTYSPDGSLIATRSRGSLKLWDSSSGNILHDIPDLNSSSNENIVFSPDGTRVSVISDASWDRSVVMLDCRTGRRIAVPRSTNVSCTAFSPSGDRIAMGSTSGGVYVWDVESGKGLLEVEEQKGWVHKVAFSPDGGEVATGSDDGLVVTYDSWTCERRFTFSVENDSGESSKCRVWDVAFSPVNDFVACGADDGSVRVWNSKDGSILAKFQGHHGWVQRVMFTGDGGDLLSYDSGGVVRLWSMRDALRLL